MVMIQISSAKNGDSASPLDAQPPGQLRRVAFETSRAMELLTVSELQKLSGSRPEHWPALLFKELVDNGIDAAEYSQHSPEIEVVVSPDGLTVQDNGGGFAEGAIEGIVKFESRTSTNSKVAGLTRGSQGLGAKITAAVSYCVSESEPKVGAVTISSRGIGKLLTIRANEVAGIPETMIEDVPPDVKNGTSVRVHWPQNTWLKLTDQCVQILHLADVFAFCNPHLAIKVNCVDGIRDYAPTDPDWMRYPPWKPSPGAWFDAERFRGLLGATLSKLVEHGASMTVRQWVSANFAGLTGSAKSGAVVKEAGLQGASLDALVADDGLRFDEDKVEALYRAVRAGSQNISRARSLGVIGETHLRCRFHDCGGQPGSFRYKVAYGETEDERAFIVEAAFVYAPGCDFKALYGVNGSPAGFGPLSDRYYSVESLLRDQCIDNDQQVIAFLHVTIPRPDWDGTGKNRLNVEGIVGQKLVDVLTAVTKDWAKQKRREEREAVAELRREEELDRQRNRKEDQISLDAAIYLEMESGIHEASGGGEVEFPGRNLYYSVRDLIQRHTDKALRQSYFDQVLKRWESEHGLIEILYRDPRGHLIEPHTNKIVPLGTREVRSYQIPEWLYHLLLYVEKKGFAPMFQKYRLAERYDMGIIAAEGYATNAAKMLMARAQEVGHKMTMLCLRDADPYGKWIHNKVCQATHRSPQIDVLDIGLTIEEGLERGLKPENFIRKKSLPKAMKLTPLEREWWEGEEHGTYRTKAGAIRPKFLCKRIELNALAKTPEAFIQYIEGKLERVGCNRKLLPPADVILKTVQASRERTARDLVQQEVDRVLDVEPIVNEITDKVCREISIQQIPAQAREWAGELHPESWRQMVERSVRDLVREKSSTISELISTQFCYRRIEEDGTA